MKLIYMHHSERDLSSNAEWGTEERKLDDITQRGIKQAQLLSERMKDLKIDAIYTSPYLRCTHTADIINKYHNLDIIYDERFNEIQIDEEWKDLLSRNIDAIKDIVSKYDNDKTILCITSGVNISAFICYAYDIAPSNDLVWTQAADLSPVIFNIGTKKTTWN